MQQHITDLQGTFKLHNGVAMPYFGLGVYLAEDGQEVVNAVKWALDAGYRHIDTAAVYNNEEGVGRGIAESGLKREEVFLVSKVWNSDQGYESTLKAFEASLQRLGTDYLDLYLVHWPVDGKYKDTWRALEKLYAEKKVRAIGVSNFLQHHLEDLMETAETVPMVNQMEFHPYLVQPELIDFCRKHKIQYEAWSPMMQGNIFKQKEFEALADKYGRSIAQVVLRWDLQKGVVTIPKSTKKERIIANSQVFDFELSQEDMDRLDAMDKGKRFGPDPDNFDF
ncbi:aldo/keto reductase [Zeaxanthinibacter enoshimensis]|uniref:Diketogulonate reductase-like aldo/keto reductase n=1 Tax=Zeaxanthinibacter enoshimensis TaxID=392009 RepID=A0A4R6TNA8_9FLAO|nr:aldo/keto reductase [Zeaxanthinibacter enoshimensis]TDQ32735.1 diketogulonate reductase-like aldo/keto reductase [Zeaxanthinibacter enoshimensis]